MEINRDLLFNSLEDFQKYINNQNNEKNTICLFRGQKDDYSLYPKLCRIYEEYRSDNLFDFDIKRFKDIEINLFEKFKENINSMNLFPWEKLTIGIFFRLRNIMDWLLDYSIGLLTR